ncbi:MAG: hypothetical protein CFE44_15620 [Burkholderiales bacterium PBB4]|nr:MAG: hypothetical protein CFE44_15620 [Burkholderiales bacterium PBB4]
MQDMAAVLAQRGFEVTALVDLDLAQARQAVDRFAQTVKAASDDATVLFYFSGHGVQVDAENLLVAAGVNPTAAPETILKGSLVLGPDVMARLPRPAKGLLITVVDACRTNLRAPTPGEGLNQVEAPPGCLIAFSTGAGKPALAPAVETVNTFYTAALVKQLGSASDELTFSDLFRLAKLDTQRTMLNHPVALIRQFAQFPFIAENLPVPVLLAQRPAATPAATAVAAAVKRFSSEDESRDWASLQATLWPPDVLRQADTYLTRYPDSKLAGGALVAREGASESAALLAKGEIRLFRRSFDPAAAGGAGGSTGGGYGSSPGYGTANTASVDEAYRAELLKAARGDKDAAARIARRWRSAAAAGTEASRYEGWLQYAAELGNGIASYELALHYRRLDQPQAAARWEARSRELGYTPPPSLDNRRK